MKTTIARQKDHQTGGVQITITLNPADLEGLIDYRIVYPQFELTLLPMTTGHDPEGEIPVPFHAPLRSEFAQLLAQVIVAELVASGELPQLHPLRPPTPERKRSTTRR